MQQESSKSRKRVWVSWSSGKDCAYTLHTLRTKYEDEYEVVGLLTTVNETAGRVAMHAVRRQLLKMQAAAAGLPVHEVMLPSPCTNEEYNSKMAAAVAAAKEANVDAIAFGDLFLEDVRAYREINMQTCEMEALFPLWLADSGRTTAVLAQEMMSAGIKAVITCVDLKRVPEDFAGIFWDQQLLQDLPEGIDPCGENGEFHTFVFDGPMFDKPLDIQIGGKLTRDGFCFCDIVPPGMSMAAAAAEVAAAAAAAAEKEASNKAAGGKPDDSESTDCKTMVQLALQQKQQQQQKLAAVDEKQQ